MYPKFEKCTTVPSRKKLNLTCKLVTSAYTSCTMLVNRNFEGSNSIWILAFNISQLMLPIMLYIIFASVIPAENAQDKSVKYAPISYAFLLNLLKLPFWDKPSLVFSPKTTATEK